MSDQVGIQGKRGWISNWLEREALGTLAGQPPSSTTSAVGGLESHYRCYCRLQPHPWWEGSGPAATILDANRGRRLRSRNPQPNLCGRARKLLPPPTSSLSS
ncbi:Os04g0372550 [Oryza sativa Japonica Group]|uniref:Os04g0372550 protein n=1 Tax=Oryza sativa subsp. japonica TaxID=39947 RepID=A0A0P0W9B0_ORYSJ|nr:Os04g0372550 [Oryza sativa Japonica Group]